MEDHRGPRVIVVGPVNIDLFVRGSAPLDARLLDQWVGPADVQLIVAGSVGYTVQALRRLGCQVELCTTTGSDAFGAHIRAELEAAGIGLGHATVAPGATGIAIYVLLFGGTKRPMTYRLPAFEPWPDPLPEFAWSTDRADLLHCGGLLHFPEMWGRSLGATFRSARRAGTLTSFDPQFPLVNTPAPWLPHLADVLAETDVFFCDQGEGGRIFAVDDLAAIVARAHAEGPRIVAVKRGPLGSVVSQGERLVYQPAVPVPADLVREAVGAGDAYDAGFLSALLAGSDVAEAARFATATATLTLMGRGGAEGIADRAAVEAMLPSVPPATVSPGAP